MRIVAGKYKGVLLNAFDCENIRPTPDKVREAVFSKIQFTLNGSVWLDLFGGTGAVGLEALSRGAERVFVCDENADSIALIIKNYEKCKIKPELIRKHFIKALSFLKDKNEKFDFIYLDPPFNANYAKKAVELIKEYGLLNENGLIIYEHLREDNCEWFKECELVDEKFYGTIKVSYLR